jgi:hypothetical protein
MMKTPDGMKTILLRDDLSSGGVVLTTALFSAQAHIKIELTNKKMMKTLLTFIIPSPSHLCKIAPCACAPKCFGTQVWP